MLAACVAAGCGSATSHRRAAFAPGVFEPSTLVRGPLPGKPASPRRVPRDVVPSSVRLLVASRGAGYVLPLYVGRDRAGRLCVGTTGTWECLRSIDAQPVFSFTLQGGHGNIRDWGAIVGLAAPDVRVTVDHANREVRLPLRRFAGFQWAAFASPMWRTRAPDALHFYDRAGHELSGFIDLAFAARPCPARNQGCTPKGEWHSIGDPVGSGPSWALGERAKRIAFGDRIVRKLLAGRRYSFDTPAVWSKCGGGTIGAVLTFHIAPAKFAEDWPLSDYDPKSHTAYVQHVEYYAVGNVTQLDVSVDTNRRKVVGVDPTNSAPDAPDPNVNEFSFHPVGRAIPGGGPDSGDCSSSGG